VSEQADKLVYRFGRFRLDPSERVLLLDNSAISLPPKAADTLLLLVENAGHVVTKEDLLKHVWQNAFVEEGSLTRTISILRKALEDDAEGREVIKTIPTRGYRFAAPRGRHSRRKCPQDQAQKNRIWTLTFGIAIATDFCCGGDCPANSLALDQP
jgi:DNA-binding winged helix-turn-helix (wHTH) protein